MDACEATTREPGVRRETNGGIGSLEFILGVGSGRWRFPNGNHAERINHEKHEPHESRILRPKPGVKTISPKKWFRNQRRFLRFLSFRVFCVCFAVKIRLHESGYVSKLELAPGGEISITLGRVFKLRGT
jgi:hypothetical protein